MLGRAPRDACSWTAAPHYNENINTLELPRVSQPVPFFRVVWRGIPSSSIPVPGFRAGQIGITVASVRGHVGPSQLHRWASRGGGPRGSPLWASDLPQKQ